MENYSINIGVVLCRMSRCASCETRQRSEDDKVIADTESGVHLSA